MFVLACAVYWQKETEEITLYRSAVNWRARQEATGQGVSEARVALGGHQRCRLAT